MARSTVGSDRPGGTSRRVFLAAAGGALLTPLGVAPALAAIPRLSAFTVLLGDGTGSATDVPSGISLEGGAYDDFQSGVRLFRKVKVGRSGRVRYRLTREAIPPVTTSQGVFFNVGLVWGRDPGTLSPATPNSDEAIAPLFRGFRITQANTNTLSPSLSDKIRLRTYPNRTDVRPRESRQVTARFAPGVPHNMEMTWTTTGVVTLYDRTLGVRQSFRSSALRVPAGGAYLMFYASFGGRYLLGDLAVG
jgi:hypothetical protein